MIKTAFANNISIKKVTNVRTIADAMQQSEVYRGMLSEIYIFYYICHSREINFITVQS